VRGFFWHGHTCKDGARSPETNSSYWKAKIARNVTRDRQNAGQLRASGWDLLEIWECELKDTRTLESLIRTFLEESSTQTSIATVEKIEDDADGNSIVYLRPGIRPGDPLTALDPRVVVETDVILDEAQEMLMPKHERLRSGGRDQG
jgi:hypothetical protein